MPVFANHSGEPCCPPRLLDTAAGCAVHTTLPAEVGYTSLDLTTKFLRPVTVDSGQLRCDGTVLNRGRTTTLAQAQLFIQRDSQPAAQPLTSPGP